MLASHLRAAQAQTDSPTANLDAIRDEIDDIDSRLLGLIDMRLDRTRAIARAKPAQDTLKLRPARERQVVARLRAQARSTPPAAIERLWREIMALGLQVQTPAELVVYAEAQPVAVAGETRTRFGSAAPLYAAASAEEALQRARTREAVAVIELTPLSSWWTALRDDAELTIFDSIADTHGRTLALAVGRIPPEEPKPALSVIEESELRQRLGRGERIVPLAISGTLRLCLHPAPQQEAEAR